MRGSIQDLPDLMEFIALILLIVGSCESKFEVRSSHHQKGRMNKIQHKITECLQDCHGYKTMYVNRTKFNSERRGESRTATD